MSIFYKDRKHLSNIKYISLQSIVKESNDPPFCNLIKRFSSEEGPNPTLSRMGIWGVMSICTIVKPLNSLATPSQTKNRHHYG